MAGFVGIYGNDTPDSSASTKEAIQATIYSTKTISVDLFNDQHFTLSKSYFDFLEAPKMSAHSNGVHVWLDGEIYNATELSQNKNEAWVDLLLKAYEEN